MRDKLKLLYKLKGERIRCSGCKKYPCQLRLLCTKAIRCADVGCEGCNIVKAFRLGRGKKTAIIFGKEDWNNGPEYIKGWICENYD